jgi:hypothetical protein
LYIGLLSCIQGPSVRRVSILAILETLGTFALACFAVFVRLDAVPAEQRSKFPRPVVAVSEFFGAQIIWIPIALASAILILRIASIFAARHAFRRSVLEEALNVLVSQCGGASRKNRITLFRCVSGRRAFCGSYWRMGLKAFSEEYRPMRRLLKKVEWGAKYLQVYARSQDAKNRLSPIIFRVSDYPEKCEGMAGVVWSEQGACKGSLPKLVETDVRLLRSSTLEQIQAKAASSRVRKYVSQTNLNSTELVHAVRSFSRHFMGQIVHTPQRRDWGVLLLDSEEEECPFDESEDGGALGRVFRTQAETIGQILRTE